MNVGLSDTLFPPACYRSICNIDSAAPNLIHHHLYELRKVVLPSNIRKHPLAKILATSTHFSPTNLYTTTYLQQYFQNQFTMPIYKTVTMQMLKTQTCIAAQNATPPERLRQKQKKQDHQDQQQYPKTTTSKTNMEVQEQQTQEQKPEQEPATFSGSWKLDRSVSDSAAPMIVRCGASRLVGYCADLGSTEITIERKANGEWNEKLKKFNLFEFNNEYVMDGVVQHLPHFLDGKSKMKIRSYIQDVDEKVAVTEMEYEEYKCFQRTERRLVNPDVVDVKNVLSHCNDSTNEIETHVYWTRFKRKK